MSFSGYCPVCPHAMTYHDSDGCIICDARWIEKPRENKRCAVTANTVFETIDSINSINSTHVTEAGG